MIEKDIIIRSNDNVRPGFSKDSNELSTEKVNSSNEFNKGSVEITDVDGLTINVEASENENQK